MSLNKIAGTPAMQALSWSDNGFNPVAEHISKPILEQIWNGTRLVYTQSECNSARRSPQFVSVGAMNHFFTSGESRVLRNNLQVFNYGSYRGAYGHGHDCLVAVWGEEQYYILWDVKQGSCNPCDTGDATRSAMKDSKSSAKDRDPLVWWRNAIMSGLVMESLEDLAPFAANIMDRTLSNSPSAKLDKDLRWRMFVRYAKAPFGMERQHRLRVLRKDIKKAYEVLEDNFTTVSHNLEEMGEAKLNELSHTSGHMIVDEILSALGYDARWSAFPLANTSPIQKDMRTIMNERIKDGFETVGARTLTSPSGEYSLTVPLYSMSDAPTIGQAIIKFIRIANAFM